MSMSTDIIADELQLLTTVFVSVLCYFAVVFYFYSKHRQKDFSREHQKKNYEDSENFWNDQNPVLRTYPLSSVYPYGSIYQLSAFSGQCLLTRTLPAAPSQSSPKLCVSRSSVDTDRILHPLIKKIESRLRRTEMRPRPRLRVERSILPFPLFSSTRADQELTNFVLEFLDASIDLSLACNTQVQFSLECKNDGVRISAIWLKNQLIIDATSQIDLLNDMRLTFHGESIRWEYQILFCPVTDSSAQEQEEFNLQKTG